MKSLSEMLHHSRFKGFGLVSSTYDQGRPGYPPEMEKWLRDKMLIRNATQVLDLGAGTGKFTRLLVDLNARVTALDIEQSMLDQLSRNFPSGVSPLLGSAEAIPAPDSSFNAVVCAQSFHLFATVAAMHEIHRVLKPSGQLGLFWNIRDASVDWVADLARIVDRYAGDRPRYYGEEWRQVLKEGLPKGYSPFEEMSWTHLHTGTPEDVIVKRIESISFIAASPQKADIIAEVRELIARHPELAGKSSVSVPYKTLAIRTAKILP